MQVTERIEIRFDGWRLRTDTGELSREGRATQRLTQQPLRILLELLERPGEVVTRERLVAVLWPKGVVDYDNGLNVAMRKLRIALGDETDTPRYIETLSRKGYRYIGTVETAAPAADPLSSRAPAIDAPNATPTQAAGSAGGSGAAGFSSPPHRRWFFAGGIVGGAVLLAAWLSWAMKPAPEDAAALIPAAPPAPSDTPIVARRTTSVRAYDHYLQGIFHRSRRDADGGKQAIAEFEAALREDPEYAEAWAGLADTYVGAAIGHAMPAHEAFQLAYDAAVEAVQLDPALAETHTALGQIHMFRERDYVTAEAEYARALAANEKYARLWHHLGMMRAFQGRPVEALAAVRRARELEPMTLLYNANYALVLYHSRRYDEAMTHVRALLETLPTFHQARSVLIRSLVATGKLDEAERELALRAGEMPNISDAALVYAHQGKRERTLAEIARIRKLSDAGFGVGYELAVAYAALGDVREGCEALELAWRDKSPFIGWMRLDPRMDPLREQPCFGEVLGRFKTG